MCSCLLCIAPTQNYIHSFSYFVLCPLQSYAPMPSPHNMFPSICFMFTFPTAPWLSPILLQNPIWFILVFTPLVSTHNLCTLVQIDCYPCLTSPSSDLCLYLIIVSESLEDLVSRCSEIWEHLSARGTTFVGWSWSFLLALSLPFLSVHWTPITWSGPVHTYGLYSPDLEHNKAYLFAIWQNGSAHLSFVVALISKSIHTSCDTCY